MRISFARSYPIAAQTCSEILFHPWITNERALSLEKIGAWQRLFNLLFVRIITGEQEKKCQCKETDKKTLSPFQ